VGVRVEFRLPFLFQFSPATELFVHVLGDFVRHEELCIGRPAVTLLGLANLLFAERFAVGAGRVLLRGRAVADVAVDDDKRRFLGLLERPLDGAVERLEIVGVGDMLDEPAVGLESRRRRPR
jgi:hypothetical protein